MMVTDYKPWIKMAAAAALAATVAGYCFLGKREERKVDRAYRFAPGIADYKEIVPEISYDRTPRLAPPDVRGDPDLSLLGRIQRTKRFDPLYDAVEDRYGLPEGTLAAVVMQESYGNPVMPNRGGDGGLGLVHFQPSTAKMYGLHVHGASTGVPKDPVNGRAIKRQLEKCAESDLGLMPCMAQYDDRAHLLRNLDATARLIKRGKERHGSWNRGIQTINWHRRTYTSEVLLQRKAYNSRRMQQRAEDDFERRNPELDFERYISDNHKRMANWGLNEYTANKNAEHTHPYRGKSKGLAKRNRTLQRR